MLLKYFTLIVFLKLYIVNGLRLYALRNGFKHLNDEMMTMFGQPSQAETRWIEQDLDHFNPKEKRTFKMRYFARLDLQEANGPVFLFLSGEAPACPLWTSRGIMYDLAKETGGAMYVSEHRYYGKSKPLNGTDAESFRFLNSKQALADNAKLLKYIKSLPENKKSKIVVIGGSYAGNLAAWLKLKYPDLVDAALASSAPVLAKTDFYEYLEKVNDNYEQYGTTNCLSKIRKLFQRYATLLQSPEGIEQIKREENLCDECDLSKIENKQVFFNSKVEGFMGNSQYGTTEIIKNHCEELNDNFLYTPEDFNSNNCRCYDFDQMIEEFYKEKNDWLLAWFYQTCTEFGYFQTTSSDSQPFTDNIPLNFYIRICNRLFGPEFDEKRVNKGVEEINELYGARRPNVTNVVFTNGDLDPWSTLSILEDLSYDAPAVVIPRAAHCRDLLPDRPGDIEELKEARKHIKYLIKNWLGIGDFVIT